MPDARQVLFVLQDDSLVLDWAGPAEALRLASLEIAELKLDVAPFALRFAAARAETTGSVGIRLQALEALPDGLPEGSWIVLVGRTAAAEARDGRHVGQDADVGLDVVLEADGAGELCGGAQWFLRETAARAECVVVVVVVVVCVLRLSPLFHVVPHLGRRRDLVVGDLRVLGGRVAALGVRVAECKQHVQLLLLAEAGASPRVLYRFEQLSSILGFVAQGHAVAIAARLALPDDAPGVVYRSLAPRQRRTTGLAVRSMKRLSPAAAAFVEVARRRERSRR